jgi:putative nucleotidyltransferase with HDIG domain
MLGRAAIRTRVEGITRILTIPPVVDRIVHLANTGTVSAAEIAEEISRDQVLAAKVLKLVNSGFYGFRQPVTTITHAMVLLGLNVVKTLVMTAAVLDIADAMNKFMKGLWEHSLGTARAANAIAEHLRAEEPEEYAVAGLLHDMGKVIIAQVFPDEHARVQEIVRSRGGLQIDAEMEVLGVSHAEIGMWLLKKWSLAPRLVYPIAYHHNFHPRRDFAERTAVIHLADVLCCAMGIGYPGDASIPRMNQEAWAVLGMGMSDVERICSTLNDELQEGLFG